MRFKTKIQGLSSTLRKIEKYSKDMANEVDNELSAAAVNAANTARTLAPVHAGSLIASITSDTTEKYNKSFSAMAPYAAYVEFGTGSKVFQAKSGFMFTPEMKDFAREFYVNGMGRMPATPFMFPALEQEKVKVIHRIKKVLLKDVRV